MSLPKILMSVRSAAEVFSFAESPQQILKLVVQGRPYDKLFFSSLNDPQWIPLLREAGLFSMAASRDEGASGVYPRLLSLNGLARVAKIAPHAAIEILEDLPIHDNPQVDDQIMRCIAQIEDPELAARSLPILDRLLRNSRQHDWIWIDDILKNWAKFGNESEAISLINIYLRSQFFHRRDLHGADSAWRYSEIDRQVVEPLGVSLPMEMSRVLFGVLRFWKYRQEEFFIGGRTAKEGGLSVQEDLGSYDPPTYWLEDFRIRTSRYHELEEILAIRLYSIGVRIFDSGCEAHISEFDEMLRSDSWSLFARLRWQLYSDYPDETLVWAKSDVLLKIPTWGSYAGSHEFEMAQMLEAHCEVHQSDFLSQTEVKEAFARIMSGPIDDNGDLEADLNGIEWFRRKQLYPIKNLLVGRELDVYGELEEDKSDISGANYKTSLSNGEARSIQYVAPEQADNLAGMADQDLWYFLNTWKPEGNRFGSDRWWIEEHVSELGVKFADLLDKEPDRFQSSKNWWRNLSRPVTLYKSLERATTRISRDSTQNVESIPPSENEWQNWFGVADWISKCGEENANSAPEGRDVARPEDRDWNWSRIIAVKFLDAAINPRFSVPEYLVPKIGILLRRFVEDEDPRLLSKDKPMLEDWLTTAINSVRGTALESLLHLALHQRKESARQQPDEWIWFLIRRTLELEGQSPAVFAIIGARLNLVLYLFSSHIKKEPWLLLSVGNNSFRYAFILAHIRYGNAMVDLLEILPGFPSAALECLEEINSKPLSDQDQIVGNFGGRLGTHLAFYYWNNAYPEGTDGEKIVDRYFEIADSSQRAKAVADVVRIFSDIESIDDHSPIYERVRYYWNRRFSSIEYCKLSGVYSAADIHDELSASVGWLDCDCHPFEWRYNSVLDAIQLLERSPQAALTMRTLDSLSDSPEKLGPCTEILELLLNKEVEAVPWAYHDREIKPILIRALHSNDMSVRRRASRIQVILLHHCLFEYLELG